MEMLYAELEDIKRGVNEVLKKDISNERCFDFLMANIFCFKYENMKSKIFDIASAITDGTNDGGIDFVYYDDESTKVILGQCKYSDNFSLNDLISELNKMSSTVENFKKSHSGSYNGDLKRELQEALDRLPEGNDENIEYQIFTTSPIDVNEAYQKIDNEHNIYSKEMVTIFTKEDILSKIKELTIRISTVPRFSIEIDKSNNILEYDTDNNSGIMVNMSSESLINMYNLHKDNGLLDLNIRKYVKNKVVDDGIKKTLDNERQNFWYLNNGIIIACKDYDVDGYTVKIEDFSIVNGGQTTNRIGNYKGTNNQKFYIPCKIICDKKKKADFYSKIAEATNSQKPIFARDLKANAPEMKIMQKWLMQENVYMEIKRGEKKENKKYRIKNDELGQFLLSFVYQQPGTARSGKKTIFDTPTYYNKIYKQNYEKDKNKKGFILDLIKLANYYSEIEEQLINSSEIEDEQKNILRNGKFIIIGIFGFLYRIANRDVSENDILNDSNLLTSTQFTYGRFVSNYTKDDLDAKLKELTKRIVTALEEIYKAAINQGTVTSVSNLFKTDKRYLNEIIKFITRELTSSYFSTFYVENINIFKREM